MKKEYMNPTMRVVRLQQKSYILSGSPETVNSVNGNVFDETIESDAGYDFNTYGIR
ncbi:MAG: hypothetical protein IKH01_09455 [Prevotella sp.]|nr:hypothetical protein [Prevotella sp.]MBR3657544.1 hypothetical protein [Prevotella sp.]